jgi:hypothetical protein
MKVLMAVSTIAAARFGIECSHPPAPLPVDPKAPPVKSLLRVEPDGVMVTSLKPSDDGKALMLRLFNVGTEPAKARVIWSEPAPKRITLSSPKEEHGTPVTGPIEMPPYRIVTLRAALRESRVTLPDGRGEEAISRQLSAFGYGRLTAEWR